jgi:integrase
MITVLHQILDRSDFSPRTKSKYIRIIDRWIAFAGDHPSSWTRDRVQEWYDALIKSGIKTQSANVYVASLRYVSRWYATKENNPSLDFAIVQTKRGRDIDDGPGARALSMEEITALLETCSSNTAYDRRDRTLIVTGLETGMRRMSLGAMTFDCISSVAGNAWSPGYPIARVPIKGAGGRARFDVPLSDLAFDVLTSWMEWLQQHRNYRNRRGPLFTTLKGAQVTTMSPTAINDMLADRSKRAGIEHVHPHLLRHTFVTTRQVMGLSVFQIAAITGHKVPGMGAAASYVDLKSLADEARNSTPQWLEALVRNHLARK